MKVAELQRFLSNFGPFAKAAGASEKVAAEFELTPPPRNSSGRTRTKKAPGLTVDAAAQIFNDLHANATRTDVSYSDIEAKLKPFEKLTVAQLKEVAANVGVVVTGSRKQPILDAFTWRIKELKASDERTQFRLGEMDDDRCRKWMSHDAVFLLQSRPDCGPFLDVANPPNSDRRPVGRSRARLCERRWGRGGDYLLELAGAGAGY